MKIVHIALGGCLRSPPVIYGLTADTGGHIVYVLAAAEAQARRLPSSEIELVTRRFEDARLGAVHSQPRERVSRNVSITRLATDDRRYLEKDALAAELPAFTSAFLSALDRAAHRPAVIHAHFADAAAVARAARERFGIPFVYTPHALGLDKASRCGGGTALNARIAAERAAIAGADAIIVSSKDEAERQLAAYEVEGLTRRVNVVAPGIPDLGPGLRLMPPLVFAEPDRPMVLAIARPMRKKNLVALAEAFVGGRLGRVANLVILAGQHDAAILGEEERAEIAALETILEEPKRAGRAALPPRHGASDVRDLYRHAARSGGIFVNPALHEPFGLTLLEAAAAGLPVVATRHGGAGDIVRSIGHGMLVDPSDREAIASSCLAIIENATLRGQLSAAARRNAASFSWDRYAQRTLAIYDGLAARTPVAA